VGSHNLTGSAIHGGNFEAALSVRGESTGTIFKAAGEHLDVCRTTAERFELGRVAAYEAMQGADRVAGLSEQDILVIHAEADLVAATFPYILDLRLPSQYLDPLLHPDMTTHLYLHAPGSLAGLGPLPKSTIAAHQGRTTGVVQGSSNHANQGVLVEPDRVDFRIEPRGVPVYFSPSGKSAVGATQVPIRIDGPLATQTAFYSVGGSRPAGAREWLAKPGSESEPVSRDGEDLRQYFTEESFERGNLVYRPAWGIRRTVKLESFGDQRSEPTEQRGLVRQDSTPGYEVDVVTATRPSEVAVARFVFVSRYVFDWGSLPEAPPKPG
jgi:hypothetical protein